MVESLIAAFFAVLIQRFPKEDVKKLLDSLFDEVEDMVALSPNKWDDKLVLPAIGILRDYFDIPDNDPIVQ